MLVAVFTNDSKFFSLKILEYYFEIIAYFKNNKISKTTTKNSVSLFIKTKIHVFFSIYGHLGDTYQYQKLSLLNKFQSVIPIYYTLNPNCKLDLHFKNIQWVWKWNPVLGTNTEANFTFKQIQLFIHGNLFQKNVVNSSTILGIRHHMIF